MAVEAIGKPRSMTSSLAKLTFSRIEFMHWVSRCNTVSSKSRLTNSDLDGFRKRPMSASIHDHLQYVEQSAAPDKIPNLSTFLTNTAISLFVSAFIL